MILLVFAEETGNDVVEAEVEEGSEDDSEDEWNYVSGKNNKKPSSDKKPQVCSANNFFINLPKSLVP